MRKPFNASLPMKVSVTPISTPGAENCAEAAGPEFPGEREKMALFVFASVNNM